MLSVQAVLQTVVGPRASDTTQEHKSAYIANASNCLVTNNIFGGLPVVNAGGTNIIAANNTE